MKLRYRDNNYFNEKDDYLIYDGTIFMSFVSKLHYSGAFWYSNDKLKYKMSSVKCINIKYLL